MFEPGVNNLMLVVCLWNTFNIVIAGAALGAVSERAQPDRHPRLGVTRKGALAIDSRTFDVDVLDVSAGGCSVRLSHDDALAKLADGARAALTVVPMGPHGGKTPLPLLLSRVEDDGKTIKLAFKFPELKGLEYYELADLMYGDSDALPNFLASRRNFQDIFRGSAQFLKWGLLEPFRSLSYLVAELRAKWGARGAGETVAPVETAPAAAQTPAVIAAPAIAPVETSVEAPAPDDAQPVEALQRAVELRLAPHRRAIAGADILAAAARGARPGAAIGPSAVTPHVAPARRDSEAAIVRLAHAHAASAEPESDDPVANLRRMLERARPSGKSSIRAA
jgi:cellulose synthase (UDP-forming)